MAPPVQEAFIYSVGALTTPDVMCQGSGVIQDLPSAGIASSTRASPQSLRDSRDRNMCLTVSRDKWTRVGLELETAVGCRLCSWTVASLVSPTWSLLMADPCTPCFPTAG